MLLNAVTIIIVLLFLIRHYSRDYDKGIRSSVFILLIAPINLALEINDTLPSLTIHRFVIVLMAIEWIRTKSVSKRAFGIPFGTVVIAITIITAISVLMSSNLLVSIKRYLFFVFESVLFFFIIANSIKNEKTVISLMKTIALALVTVALLGIMQRYTKFNPSDFFGDKHTTEFERATYSTKGDVFATYQHRILFGAGMAIAALYSLFLLDRSESRREKILLRIATFISIAALYYGMSRGPWLAFCGASLATMAFGPNSLKKQYIIIIALALLALVIRPGVLETLESFYESTFQTNTIKGASAEWRLIVLKMAFTKVTDPDSIANFFFGYGQGSHLFLEFPRVQLDTGHSAGFYSWDNEFAVILLEHGYIGITLYLILYLAFIKKTLIYCVTKKKHWKLMVLPMTAIMALVFMKTSVKFFTPQLETLEFMNIAFASVLLSDFSLWKEQVVSRPWIKQAREEITR